MRRRLRSAALPIHRHALPQLALDAGLVALAYYLAYRLRFDEGIPSWYMDLFWRTLAFAIVGSLLCFVGVGMYRHWMRYSSQREYIKIAQGVVLERRTNGAGPPPRVRRDPAILTDLFVKAR